ncbi:Hypothetical protein A7982_02931 [Minicystis rosea]|nr:Hypothetical protein A7982_02931 [Minicystis rosea]
MLGRSIAGAHDRRRERSRILADRHTVVATPSPPLWRGDGSGTSLPCSPSDLIARVIPR